MTFPTIEHAVGNTRLVKLQRMAAHTNSTVLLKLEGDNPAGSVKDRPALNMIVQAELRGDIKPGDRIDGVSVIDIPNVTVSQSKINDTDPFDF